ncbi:acetyl-CoA synthetase-like protein [Aspergillus ellipticus CBS 707.79]|uniref:Acetyl-CoA synthetase-like protein n=1 Tax=Aspergillus ellipticus CBS 707.79 TaxID=1448320 RepID=A0A319D4J5_9EURO|nr:acetyl-CoA synthetase-like protein [Aspergillus ellipticus CBS 707.79]
MGTISIEYAGMFPVLNDGNTAGTTAHEISPELIERVLAYTSNKSCDLTRFLQTVWAIVLRQYVDSDDLSFFQCGPHASVSCQALLALEGGQHVPYRLSFLAQTALISDQQAKNVASTISHVITEFLTDSNRAIGQLSLFSENDKDHVLGWSNKKRSSSATYPSILESIRAQAAEHPHATAICAPDGDMTYAELDSTSTQLAKYLHGLGVGPGVFVPLLFHRCQWVVVAQLAVLKAAGAFVPLEPSHPDLRLADIIRRTNCGFLLTSKINNDRAAGLAEKAICRDGKVIEELPSNDETVLLPPKPNASAYVLFTSGSTGQPKGCVVEHKAMATIPEQVTLPCVGLSAGSRALQFASYSFVISIVEIYFSLSTGATVCILSDHDRINNLSGAMEERGVTWACITPSLLRSLDASRPPSSLETVLLGGEPVRNGEFDAWAATVNLVHVYGASENSGAIGFVHPSEAIAFNPFPSMRFWLVDAVGHDKVAPVGAIGELVLEGPSLARGYLNDPQVSSVFIKAPSWRYRMGLSDTAAVNLYRTGDLFRYDQVGAIRYVGRKGTQVKIRGSRLDLGEVEFHVRQSCPEVARVIAEIAAPADANGVPILVAFLYSPNYIQKQEREAETLFAAPSALFRSDAALIHERLQTALPSHMVPSGVVPLAILPLTVTGKVDRRKLRESLQKCTRQELESYQSAAVDVVAATSSLESGLHSVFAQVLGISDASFGVDHSFVRLGGDSLSAMRVVSLCRSKEYPPLGVADVLEHQTVRNLAQYLESIPGASRSAMATLNPFLLVQGKLNITESAANQCQVPINAVEDIYPCTALQEGVMVSTIKVPGRYIARCIFHVAHGIDLTRLQAAWQATVNANAILRTRIVQSPSDGILQAVLHQNQSGITWKSYGSIEAYQREDGTLSMGIGEPLARFGIIQDSASDLSIALALHHAIFDMHSLDLVLDQVQKAYYGDQLDPRPFGPFIHFFQGQDDTATRKFWGDKFTNFHAPVFPSLPHDAYVPKATAELHEVIALPPNDSNITLSNMVRLAWAIVVSSHTDSEDVVFGVTVTGRATPITGVEEITGPTIATVPVRIDCHGDQTVAEALSTVQKRAIQMIAFEQTGLQNIRQISPETAAACDFQTELIFQRPDQMATYQDPPIIVRRTGGDDWSVFINYAIGLVCTPAHDNKSLHIRAQFDPNVLSGHAPSRLVTQFANILQQICKDQSQRIQELDLVTEEDLEVMKQGNGGDVLPAMSAHTLHELVLENARKEPLAPAISSWDQQLTYQGLATLSFHLGQQIMQAGVLPGDRVALCFEKSIWPVVSMLGALRTGAVVVNIDPGLPPARIEAIFKISQASLILTSPSMRPVVECLSSAPLLGIGSGIPTPALTMEWPVVQPQDVAFILFTSGTTGTPKGIVIEHRHFTTAFHHISEAAGTYPGMRTLHFCSYAWDVSIEEVFLTWINGGCLCIPSETQRMSNLTAFIREHRVNWAAMTPSAATFLTPNEVPGLRTLRLIGETIPIELMDMWSSRLRLINGFGPAEAYTCGSLTVEPDMHFPGRIGPLFGAAGWVTVPNDVNRLAPMGAVGELLIEGPTVTQGYFSEPQKTRDAFIEAPAWLQKIRPHGATGRIYRSGDLVRYDESGYLHYVGRKDSQLHFPSAGQVVADIIRPRESATALLAVFIARESSSAKAGSDVLFQAPDEDFLEQTVSATARLQEALPAHMIPTAMIPVSHIPCGRTGKVDRRTLRQAAEQLSSERFQCYTVGGSSAEGTKQPPNTPAEVMWQALWARVLSIPADRIGRDDHLFQIGADSIQVMKLVALSRHEGLTDVTFHQIVKHPRLKEIALVAHL